MKKVYAINELCLGCRQCETACSIVHSNSKSLPEALYEADKPVSRITIRTSPGHPFPTIIKCRQCDPAPCGMACPTDAIRRNENGVVVIDFAKCIGCGKCRKACHYEAIDYVINKQSPERRKVAIKCDECSSRLSGNDSPACVEACRSGALLFSEKDPRADFYTVIKIGAIPAYVPHTSNAPCDYATFFNHKKTAHHQLQPQ